MNLCQLLALLIFGRHSCICHAAGLLRAIYRRWRAARSHWLPWVPVNFGLQIDVELFALPDMQGIIPIFGVDCWEHS